MPIIKTRAMLQVERYLGESLETGLPKMVEDIGSTAAADQLGIARKTLYNWMTAMGFRVGRVLVRSES